MTNTQLVEIQPRELKFTFEVKKQSSCAVHVANITDQYVAFKVKTTSPKKYCVRPNIGVVKPKSTYDFTVTMQAQRTAPSDMQCKDKFLIQCTIVPFGTSEEEIPPSMFNKDNGKYIEECKLKVVLVSPPQSPVLQPANGISKQGASIETLMQQEKFPSGVENLPPIQTVAENNKGADFDAEEEDPRLTNTVEDVKLNSPNNRESNTNEVVESRNLDMEIKLLLSKDVEELNFKINSLDSQLIEAECIIAKLKEEERSTIKDIEILKQELALLRTKGVERRAQVGFPPLFLCMVGLICLTIGYLVRA
ncbi:vesicle-associated protein 1-1 isoform X2 [Capsicum annuum]|uniref:vesicle-associated protein 1-1 isoform X2 n=1 Tax=Capsicum annuum TaxID=4072 RepID=UPI001FB093A2|nr:vesicle-associated protein 1-1 isoform X2 [Capsicum annuum]